MKISVVIATYHGEAYLKEQLLSIFAQKLPPTEVWIGDDSEDDTTERSVQVTLHEAPSGIAVHYLRNHPRRGILGNFRNLAEQTTGDLICFSDQDDVWLPGKLQRLAALMAASPKMQVVGCNSSVVDEKLFPTGKFLYGHLPPGDLAAIAREPDYAKIVWPRFAIYGHNICMRKSFLPVFQEMPLTRGIGHDIWLTQTAALLGVMQFVNEPLTLYRVHTSNSSELTLQTLNESWLHRLRATLHSRDDLDTTMANLDALRTFAQKHPEIPECPRNVLERNWEYFHLRLRLRNYWRPFRWLAWTPTLLRDYFHCGTGLRALLRDQLL